MVRFSDRMVPEVFQTFWAAMQRGEFITDAAAQAGTYRKKGAGWIASDGGVRPRRGRNLKGRCLTLAQREEIAIARARGIEPGKVFDLTLPLDQAADGYRAMDERRATKALLTL